jgi:hypothetical protein
VNKKAKEQERGITPSHFSQTSLTVYHQNKAKDEFGILVEAQAASLRKSLSNLYQATASGFSRKTFPSSNPVDIKARVKSVLAEINGDMQLWQGPKNDPNAGLRHRLFEELKLEYDIDLLAVAAKETKKPLNQRLLKDWKFVKVSIYNHLL